MSRARRTVFQDIAHGTWPFGPALAGIFFILAACTAPPPPPQAQPAPPPPPVQVRVGVASPGGTALDLDASVAQPVEAALAGLPAVRQLYTRSSDGRVDVVATLSHAGALPAVRDALSGIQSQLPSDAEVPVLRRIDDVQPALTVATLPEFAGTVATALQRVAGVGRVDLCGVGEPRTAVLLDRTRLAGVPLDALIAGVTAALDDDGTAPLHERLAARPITGALQLRDVAALKNDMRPPPCRAWTARGPVALVTAFTQSGADPAEVAARARPHAVDLVSPTVDFFADPVPAEGASGLVLLALEVQPRDDLGSLLAGCLAAVPDLPAWALTVAEQDPTNSVARARVLVGHSATFPIDHVRNALSRCTGVGRVAALAPRAHADHGLSLGVQGPDPQVRADLAGRLAELVRGLPGVTGVQVLAAHAPTLALQLRRDDLAARGVTVDAVVSVLRLAVGPLTVRGPFPAGGLRLGPDLAVDIDVLDRTGPLEQLLRELHVGSATGPVPLAELVRVEASAGGPLDRIDRVPTAAVQVRLRSAADGDAVRRAIQQFELPPGVVVTQGGELPEIDP
ncbi:efflux RND transporter permease subunit [Nannocystis sp. SCPEA4]|uniref:efflux RND transporter permease subunit n=1 Tax=Nannocystis sp. SCPEA4 TaxID=2996787 RepID=UPI002270346E|nr:efflux RND transporter permease subunit [Nannocystis sp. SCPEA4]MCY1060365.1 efflux RND transporter permease subunit [Nannocystis sp. SCPEA4]